jgi:cobalt-zinc-cadmium efflux system protein
MAVGVNLLVAAIELAGGLVGRSMALLADAGHNATDVVSVALALLAVQVARRPPDAAKSFGYHRGGVLAAQANAAGVLVACVLITFGAVDRLLHPLPVHGAVVVVTAGVALLLNAASALLVVEKGGRDLNMRATLLHMAGDAGASGGVVLAGVAVLLDPGLRWLDPVVSLAIAALIGAQALHLYRQVADVLLEGTPLGTDTSELAAAVRAIAGVDDLHDLHVWSLSSEIRLASAHLVMSGHPSLEQAQLVAESVRTLLARDFGIAHSTLELECETCADGSEDPCAMVPNEIR